MVAIIAYLLLLLLLPFSLYIFSITRRNASDDRENLPPGSRGWPILGENIKFALSGPEKFLRDRMEKHSRDIFQTSLLGEKMAIFCGARGNKFLFTNENKLVASWWPKSLNKVLVFPESVGGNLKADSAFRRILQEADTLRRQVPVMDYLAGAHFERYWKPNTVVRVLPLSKRYTFELVCRLFLGEVDPARIKRLSDPFTVVTEGMLSVPVDLPGTAYRRAIKAGEKVREELVRIIRERKEEKVGCNQIESSQI